MTKEEAINIVRNIYQTDAEKEALQTLIPELFEGEDERMVRKLESFLSAYGTDYFSNDEYREIEVWLERQKENPKSAVPIPSNCVSDAKCEDRWHKVDDFLPDNPREVLCKDEAGNYFIGRYYVGEGWEISNYDDEDKPHHLNPPVSKWIDFPLEKQKEQKPISAVEVLARAGLKPYKDGNQWCILAGDNIQEGICGFGDTVDEALYQFLMEVLERQKEQKPIQFKNNELVDIIKGEFEGFRTLLKKKGIDYEPQRSYWEGFARLFDSSAREYVKERKPAEWSEDYREEDIQTRFAFYTYKDDPSVLYLSNVFVEEASRNHGFGTRILKAAEKAAEAVGAISIRLKVKQDSRANAWYRKMGYGYFTFEGEYDWLEKTLEYLKPSKSAEWSEEDKHRLSDAVCFLKSAKSHYADTGEIEKTIAWLKSLRSRPKAKLTLLDENIIDAAVAFVKQNDHFNCWGGIDKEIVL